MPTSNAKRFCVILMCSALLLCGFGEARATGDISVVVPNGFDHLEGDMRMYPIITDNPPPGFREQALISAIQFLRIEQPMWITGWSFRPDASATTPRQVTYHDCQVRLSTTAKTPNTISTRYADNIGPDETLVFSDTLIFSTEGGPGLKGFDYVSELQEPFYYDPNEGNLLIDFRAGGISGSPTNSTLSDLQSVPAASWFALLEADDPDATIGQIYVDHFYVIKFTFRPTCYPELKADLNDDCGIDFLDLAIMASEWLNSNPWPLPPT